MQIGLISKQRVGITSSGSVSHRVPETVGIKHITISGVVLTQSEAQDFDNEDALRENRACRREAGSDK